MAFAISNDGGESWDKAWDFPANQPFDQGFGPGYNCEHGLLTAKNKTKLLLSKPTATLHGDANGEPRSRCSPGPCVYRRNLTISESDDGGASWTTQPWGLIYTVCRQRSSSASTYFILSPRPPPCQHSIVLLFFNGLFFFLLFGWGALFTVPFVTLWYVRACMDVMFILQLMAVSTMVVGMMAVVVVCRLFQTGSRQLQRHGGASRRQDCDRV